MSNCSSTGSDHGSDAGVATQSGHCRTLKGSYLSRYLQSVIAKHMYEFYKSSLGVLSLSLLLGFNFVNILILQFVFNSQGFNFVNILILHSSLILIVLYVNDPQF